MNYVNYSLEENLTENTEILLPNFLWDNNSVLLET